MSDQFLGEIRIFPFNFAPLGWAFCSGQVLPISQYTALFSIIGTYYGGNGTSNFQLPDLQGSVPLGVGQGPGLTDYVLGEQGGSPTVILSDAENPSHNHLVNASTSNATTSDPQGNIYAKGHYQVDLSNKGVINSYVTSGAKTQINVSTINTAGQGLPHNNMMPFLTLNFCIALQGIFRAATIRKTLRGED
jgi:microcystin-dependent protein